MLNIPEQYKKYKLIGVDPGLNFTGISEFIIDSSTNEILDLSAFTLIVEKLPDYSFLYDENYDQRQLKLYKLKTLFKNIILEKQPNVVCCEAPFYNRFRPMAYGALLETVSVLRSAVLECNINIEFHMVEPLLVKKTIGVKIMKGKNNVEEALEQIDELKKFITRDIYNSNNFSSSGLCVLDEHSRDAIGVGYTYLKLRG